MLVFLLFSQKTVVFDNIFVFLSCFFYKKSSRQKYTKSIFACHLSMNRLLSASENSQQIDKQVDEVEIERE